MRRQRPGIAAQLSRHALIAGVLLGGAAHAGVQDGDEKYIRVRDRDGGDRVSLEISVRTLENVETATTVRLVGVAHIAQESYYRTLQQILDAHDLVLFEGVGAPWSGEPEGATDEWRAWATGARARLVAAEAERQRREFGVPPVDSETLIERAGLGERRQIRDALTDAWGNRIAYVAVGDGFELVSPGADGKPGGGDDVRFSEQPPIADEELAIGDGIQSQLADAAGLVFQLDHIDYDQENWINADVTVTELFGGEGEIPGGGEGEVNELLSMLSGESFMAKVVGFVLKLVGTNESTRSIFRIALIEMLGRMDELMPLAGAAMGGDEMVELLLDKRNEVVLEKLRERLADVPPGGSVAIFYGAGHLPGLEEELLGGDEYVLRTTEWLPAIEVDYTSTGLSRVNGEMFRNVISNSMDRQIKMLERMGGE